MDWLTGDTAGIVAAVCIAGAIVLAAKLVRDSTEPEDDRFPDYTKQEGDDE